VGRKGLPWSCNGSRAKEFSIKLTNQSLVVPDLSFCCMSGWTSFWLSKIASFCQCGETDSCPVLFKSHVACKHRVPEVNLTFSIGRFKRTFQATIEWKLKVMLLKHLLCYNLFNSTIPGKSSPLKKKNVYHAFICTAVHSKHFNHFRGSLNQDQCAVSTFLDFCTGTLALLADALRGHLHNTILK